MVFEGFLAVFFHLYEISLVYFAINKIKKKYVKFFFENFFAEFSKTPKQAE